jgi:hypothetical protein
MQEVDLVPSGRLCSCELHERLQDTAAKRFGDMEDLHNSLVLAVVVREFRHPTGGILFKEVMSPSVGS